MADCDLEPEKNIDRNLQRMSIRVCAEMEIIPPPALAISPCFPLCEQRILGIVTF